MLCLESEVNVEDEIMLSLGSGWGNLLKQANQSGGGSAQGRW